MTIESILAQYKMSKSAITIGSFDGVHLGHQNLIRQLVRSAEQNSLPSIAITFWPHPAVFFNRAPLAYSLTTVEERSRMITQLGVKHVITLEFDKNLAHLDAYQFISLLKKYLGLEHMVTGPNFALGRERSGDLTALSTLSEQQGFSLQIVQPLQINDQLVSSSLIRKKVVSSQIREANQMLGHVYQLHGDVIHGEARGGKLGIPTANLAIPPERLLPGNGVYATRVQMGEKRYSSVTNIGVRPTFENPLPSPRVEPHILDMNANLYGSELTLEFIDFIRPERKFDDSDALVAQIQKDIVRAREVLASEE
jgi:riboflavin kinase/FMN adenylyltransferase